MRRALLFISPIIFFLSCHTKQQVSHSNITREIPSATPALFAEGIISTGDYETHPAFSPGGDTVYFLKCMPNLSASAICVSYRNDNGWTSPSIVSFSGKYFDIDPFVTKDGNTIYFVSNRPFNKTDTLNSSWDIWKTKRNGNSWSEPVHLDSQINSIADEHYPTLSDNGTLYFGSERNGGRGGADIYCATSTNDGSFAAVVNLGDSINSSSSEYEAFIAPDETYIICMATPNTLSNADLYISYKTNDAWSRLNKIDGPANSSTTDWGPKVTRDGRYFFFGSTRASQTTIPGNPETISTYERRLRMPGNGLSDIYYMDPTALSAKK
jgi:hypothetical protein